MDRREMVYRLSLGLGVSISVPALILSMDSCKTKVSGGDITAVVFNRTQLNVVRELAEFILPATDTPGAGDLQLHLFADRMINAVYDDGAKNLLLEGLEEFRQKCKARYQMDFPDCTEDQKSEFIKEQERISPLARPQIWGNPVGPDTRPDFYRQMKSLILLGYFTSERVGKDLLHYEPVPGKFDGCTDLVPGQKIDAL